MLSIVLPGGIGTCEELFTTWSARMVALHAKPFVVLDPDGHYIGLLNWIRDIHARGFVSAHHRRYARRDLAVEECGDPLRWLDDWCALYQNLCARHEIRGLPALSRAAFRRQLAVPGLLALRASPGAETLGMVLWYRQGDVAYYHLAAYSDEGYRQRASFPLFWLAFERLAATGVRWAGLGAGPSSSSPSPSSSGAAASQGSDGLVRFKRGWSTGTRTTYLGGRIFRPDTYCALARERGFEESRYFPAYRQGELA